MSNRARSRCGTPWLRGAVGVLLSLAALSLATPARADCSAMKSLESLQLCHSLEAAARGPGGLTAPAAATSDEGCSANCFVLDKLVVTGSVGETLAFELRGAVRARAETQVPLFGTPQQVRLDRVTVNGAPATVFFENNSYFLFAPPGAFVLRGQMTLGTEQQLVVEGPLNLFVAHLARGRLVEGESVSGVRSQTLHFDPMTPESASKQPATFRLSRLLRIGREIAFTYRVAVSQGTDIGTRVLQLRHGEKVREVSGAPGWSQSGSALSLPIAGREGDVTITGTLPKLERFTTDEDSAYEWWTIENEPDHRVTLTGEGKLVDNGQSPIQASLPTARTFLIQRGQHLDVESKSLLRGSALAAVARTEKRFVAVTPSGETIIDDLLSYENNGTDHLIFTPAGAPMYVSTDGVAEPIYHTRKGAKEVLVPLGPGSHQLRTQSIAQVKLRLLAGLLSAPMHALPIATSASTVTIGLPADLRPIAVFGGDATRWTWTGTDLSAIVLGVVAALLAFRTRRTRALGALATTGLWIVSSTAFVTVAMGLLATGLVFVASRFVRGHWLALAGAVTVATSLLVTRSLIGVVTEDATVAARTEVQVPQPDSMRHATHVIHGAEAETPLSMSIPRSDQYVTATRQLITERQPFEPRVLYLTTHAVGLVKLAWLGVTLVLAWQFRGRMAGAWAIVRERLEKRPEPPPAKPAPAYPPVFDPLAAEGSREGR